MIIGDGACGKTSLLSVFTLGYFPTVGLRIDQTITTFDQRSPPHLFHILLRTSLPPLSRELPADFNVIKQTALCKDAFAPLSHPLQAAQSRLQPMGQRLTGLAHLGSDRF